MTEKWPQGLFVFCCCFLFCFLFFVFCFLFFFGSTQSVVRKNISILITRHLLDTLTAHGFSVGDTVGGDSGRGFFSSNYSFSCSDPPPLSRGQRARTIVSDSGMALALYSDEPRDPPQADYAVNLLRIYLEQVFYIHSKRGELQKEPDQEI
jgi:hypothetical protein